LILEEYQDIAIPGQSEVHSKKKNFCHIGDSHEDSHMKKQCFSSSRHEPVLYLISSPWVEHGVFLSYLTSSQSSGSNDCVNEDEDEPSITYVSPLQRWIDQASGYACRLEFQGDRDCCFSFQHDFLPPTHLHEFYFMIDYMFIYVHDYYALDLSLLFQMIKHREKCLRPMIRWLHWLYDFT
jgi:hypothetical protein